MSNQLISMRDVLPGEGISLKNYRVDHHATLSESILRMVWKANRMELLGGWPEPEQDIEDSEQIARWKMSVNLMFYFIDQKGEPKQTMKEQDAKLSKIFSFGN